MSRVELARGAWGICQIIGADVVSTRVLKFKRDSAAPAVIRVLGARHLAQALVTSDAPSVIIHRVGAAVDMLHAFSMAVVAVIDHDKRRAALTSAGVALVFAAAELQRPRR